MTLYEQGLTKKDKRLVNWDPGLSTAISDLEVEARPIATLHFTIRWKMGVVTLPSPPRARNHVG